MNLLKALSLFIVLSLIFGHSLYAQSKPEFRPIDISISEGIISSSEIKAFYGGPMEGYMSTPYKMTGAVSLSFHKSISDRCSFGISLGLDNETGDLSYGRVDHSVWGLDGVSGVYSYKTYSVAGEFKFLFYSDEDNDGTAHKEVYGLLGAGFTSGSCDYKIFDNALHQDFFYGTGGRMPTNPYSQKVSYFNWQVTPWAIRWGKKVGFFLEVGYGYKGILVGGLSCRM